MQLRWNRELLESMAATPWNPSDGGGAQSFPVPTYQRKYVTSEHIDMFGPMLGCRSCAGQNVSRSEECKQRMTQLLGDFEVCEDMVRQARSEWRDKQEVDKVIELQTLNVHKRTATKALDLSRMWT